ncbi:NADPH-dependent FMN reductase [Methanocaldococcus infernus ME]|uniref:NADPH-dependent FMN reductase n=1 Tax=Methanocaldococcus infernus (strain DSM 11812 / JCM 15783 / ME) TaxID=573063 RepID=D5VQL7_METIM|nr:flavodoxin family protein [Methanocaldococcus infernus]ADG12870.1 NADPH-dependent FMN reductase [Methanocaldococcus infernus ME]
MKILGISGSPRLEGTHYLVNYSLNYLKEKGAEVRYFTVHKKKINFCRHCDFCVKKREGCVFKDDMEEVYKALEWADGVIIGTPVYQGNVTGQLKTLMDRLRALVAKNPKVLSGKVGMGIAVGGDRCGGQEIALRTIHDFYLINEMIPVSGGSFGANLGATFWSRDRGEEGVKEDEEGMRSLRKTLNRFYKTLLEKK